MAEYVAAIDQGTTSTRCILFDHDAHIAAACQIEHQQFFPEPGWVEHDPLEIWRNTQEVIEGALEAAKATGSSIAAIGITNQRETTLLWDRRTGEPLHNAIVWQDTRTDAICRAIAKDGGQDRYRAKTGLPLATYFSGPKMRWLLDNVPGARSAVEEGKAVFGTVDSYLLWWLTGGPSGGIFVTDVTNASRTLLMDLSTLDWDDDVLSEFAIPRHSLPEIRSNSEIYGAATGTLAGVPIAGMLGDQQAALVGQACFKPGMAKNTYGTGCFLLMNTGERPVASQYGLLTTVGYKLGNAPAVYALEGSIAVTGSLVQWLRDNLGIIQSAPEVETLARTVPDNGGVYIVPAFSGLFAPHWRGDARGVIAGLTRFANKGHIARAALEATAFQTQEVVEAMEKDSGVPLDSLRVDGGMIGNELLMQFQADILGVPVIRPRVTETTALGAAAAAGLAVGFWSGLDEFQSMDAVDRTWTPQMDAVDRSRRIRRWQRAVSRTLDWECD